MRPVTPPHKGWLALLLVVPVLLLVVLAFVAVC
jgi:hypothetical protein